MSLSVKFGLGNHFPLFKGDESRIANPEDGLSEQAFASSSIPTPEVIPITNRSKGARTRKYGWRGTGCSYSAIAVVQACLPRIEMIRMMIMMLGEWCTKAPKARAKAKMPRIRVRVRLAIGAVAEKFSFSALYCSRREGARAFDSPRLASTSGDYLIGSIVGKVYSRQAVKEQYGFRCETRASTRSTGKTPSNS